MLRRILQFCYSQLSLERVHPAMEDVADPEAAATDCGWTLSPV